MRKDKKKPVKRVENSTPKEEDRHREFETPSQRRNRDGVGRGPSGSDGSPVRGRGSNH
jgi:hypothetical protein